MKVLYQLIIFTIVLIGFSCTKISNQKAGSNQLTYVPFGKDGAVKYFFSTSDTDGIVSFENIELIGISKNNLQSKWRTRIPFDNNQPVFTPKGNIFSFGNPKLNPNNICFSQINLQGKIISMSIPNNKLIDVAPNASDYLVSQCHDGNKGVYAIIVGVDTGIQINNITADKGFIIHINENNQVDRKIRLNEYYIRICCDDQGNLYGLRRKSTSNNIDLMEFCKFNSQDLINNQLKKEWTQEFNRYSLYNNFYWQAPLSFDIYNNRIYIAKPDVMGNNLIKGIDFWVYDNLGNLINQTKKEFETLHDYFLLGGFIRSKNGPNGMMYAINFASICDFVYITENGEKSKDYSLKGENSICRVESITYDQGQIWVGGLSGVGKASVLIPYIYKAPF